MDLFERFRVLIGRSNPTILDVGANNGHHTQRFLETFPYATVFSFEPEPRAIAKFRAHVNNPRATLFELAVGAQTGRATFHRSTGVPPNADPAHFEGGWDESGSLRKPARHVELIDWVKFGETLEIEVTRLDDWAAQTGVNGIDMIWADVQGAEADLIAGGRETLRRTRYFYTEYSDVEMYEGEWNLDQITAALPEFDIVEVFPNDVLLRNRHYAI